MDKLISLNTIRFSNVKGEFVVEDPIQTVFGDIKWMEKVIQERHQYYEQLFGIKLVIAPNQNETLSRSDIFAVFMYTATFLKITQSDILRRTRKTEIIEARRFAIVICTEKGIKPSVIGREIKFDHATVGHHRDLFYKFCDTEKGYHDRFLAIREYVLSKLNGRFQDDGSGEKKKEENDKSR